MINSVLQVNIKNWGNAFFLSPNFVLKND